MSEVYDPFLAGIVRILNKQNGSAGSGFIIALSRPYLFIATCTHVIQQAYPEALELPQAKTIPLLFQTDSSVVPMLASVEMTTPDTAQDITILRVEGDIPKRVRPLRLCLATDIAGRHVWTFGYPRTGEILGAWGQSNYCKLGPKKDGSGQSLLQLESPIISAGFSGAPVWDDTHHAVVGMITDVARSDSLGRGAQTAYAIPVEALHKCFNDVFVLPPSPFHGLAPFPEGDAHQFFGYTETIEQLAHTLHSSRRFLAVLGPAGCGKTSVVQAGLLPRLREERIDGFHGCGILVAHLTDSPFEQLQALGLEGAAQDLAESIHSWCQQHHHTRLVLVVDQLEELLQHCPDPLQTYFLDQLADIARGHDATIIVILNDAYYSLLVSHTKLTRLVESNLVNVIAPQIKNLFEESIQKRLESYGVIFTPQLVERLAHDLVNAQAQHGEEHSFIAQYELFLTQLWQQRPSDQKTIDISDISFETLHVNLNEWADKIFLALPSEKQTFVKQVLLQLIQFENARRTPSEVLYALPLLPLCQNEHEQQLLYQLCDQGLLATYRDVQTHEEHITIAQKLLLNTWTRLKEWVTEEHHFHMWQHTIEQKATRWISSSSAFQEQKPSPLLDILELQEAKVWLEKRTQDVPLHTQTFIALQEQRQEEHNTKSRELEENKQQLSLAKARQLAAQAKKLREQGDLELSVLLSVEAIHQMVCVETYQALHAGMALLPRLEATLFHNNNGVHFATFSANGCYLATATLNGMVWIRDISAGGTLFFPFRTNTPLHALAFNSDGTYLVTVNDTEEAHVWKTQSGQLHVILSHKRRIRAATFSPTLPSLVATASDDCMVGLWEIESDGGNLLQWIPHKEPVKTVLFSQDGQLLVTTSGTNAVHVYSVERGRLLDHLQHTGALRSVTLSPDGLTIALVDGTSSVRLWEWKNEQKNERRKNVGTVNYVAHEKPVQSVTFSPDGTMLATVCENIVTIWNRVNLTEHCRLSLKEHVTSVALNNTGTLLAAGSSEGVAHLWETSCTTEYLRITHQKAIHIVAFSPNGRFILTGSEDGSAKLWETTRGGQVARIHQHNGAKVLAFTAGSDTTYTLATAGDDAFVQLTHFAKNSFHFGARFLHGKQVRALAWSPIGAYLATGGDDEQAKVWKIIDGSQHLTVAHRGSVHAMAWSPNGHCIASASEDGTAQVWNVETQQMQIKITHHSPIYTAAFHPARPLIATGSLNGWVSIWTYEQAEESQMLAHVYYESSINKVVFSPDGHLLASASDDGNVRVWTWAGDKQQFLLLTHDEPVYALAFSRDGFYLASASSDGAVKIWETNNGQMIAYLSHTHEVWAISFSTDGNYLATASSDHTARIWEKASGQQIASFPHTKSVYDVGFSPDGKYIVTASGDGTASVWLWQPEDIIAEACQRLRRNLTREEWQQYMGNDPYRQTCQEALWRGIDSFSDG